MTDKEKKDAFLISRVPMELKQRIKDAAKKQKKNLSVLVREVLDKAFK